ncbi:hypothetical protein GWI33_007516 [Rhynchophorus ferrugineus]|uniref:Uncharacterized protein n=1 Tax=Rhynchophorus ferrugineus TaxID=354439 RepID=A0A834IEE2_RHYFE|nr:hypothetical protein GWI33_007516 [Rhynchophorus ferrugineus]
MFQEHNTHSSGLSSTALLRNKGPISSRPGMVLAADRVWIKGLPSGGTTSTMPPLPRRNRPCRAQIDQFNNRKRCSKVVGCFSDVHGWKTKCAALYV